MKFDTLSSMTLRTGLALMAFTMSLAVGHAQPADQKESEVDTDERYIVDKINWEQVEQLPGGATLYVAETNEGNNRCYTYLQSKTEEFRNAFASDPGAPCRLRVWMAKVPITGSSLKARTLVDDGGRLLKLSTLASNHGALVAINGGFFLNDGTSVSPVGKDGHLLFKGINSVQRQVGNDISSYFLARGAFYIKDGKAGLGWMISGTERLVHLAMPMDNHMGSPDTQIPNIATEFQFDQLVGGGPMLVRDGYKFVTWDREVFFGSSGVSFANREPRSAIGIRNENGKQSLYFIVVEGRSGDRARGLNLQELADLMIRENVQNAMNLDGGGSSALYFNGRIVNHLSEKGEERLIKSAIGIFNQ